MDFQRLSSSASRQVDKLTPHGEPKAQHQVLESAVIVAAVVCLSLVAEYVFGTLAWLLGLSGAEDVLLSVADDEAFIALQASFEELNATASTLQATVQDVVQENVALHQVRCTRWVSPPPSMRASNQTHAHIIVTINRGGHAVAHCRRWHTCPHSVVLCSTNIDDASLWSVMRLLQEWTSYIQVLIVKLIGCASLHLC